MDMHELTNTPLEFSVGGRKFKAARLSVGEIYGTVEAEIKQEYLDNLAKISGKLDPKDRPQFARLALQSMPQGRELEQQVNDRLMTVGGNAKLVHMALSKHQKVTLDEVINLCSDGADDMAAMTAHILGIEPQEPAKEETKANP